MSAATLTSKGQITLPKDLRDELNLKPGDKVDFVKVGRRFEIVPRNRSIAEFAGILGNPLDRAVSLEEMDEAWAESAAERFRRSTR